MKFLGRSLLILLALYGLVFAIGDLYLAHAQAPFWSAIVFVVVVIGIQYLIAPWLIHLVLAIDFTEELPAINREFVEQLCAERGLKVPRIGIIRSGTPNLDVTKNHAAKRRSRRLKRSLMAAAGPTSSVARP